MNLNFFFKILYNHFVWTIKKKFFLIKIFFFKFIIYFSIKLIFFSIYYWKQRFYEVGEIPQPGHESTKEEYLENASKTLISPISTLREDGVLAVNIADSIVDGIPQRIPYLFIEYVEKNTPLKFIGLVLKNPLSFNTRTYST